MDYQISVYFHGFCSVYTDLNIYEHAIGEDDDPRRRHDKADALNIENIGDEVRLHETIPQSEHKC